MNSGHLKTLTVVRSAIGASSWLSPIAAGRLFGLDASSDVSAALYLRMAASRDFALAAGPVLADRRSRRLLLRIGAACDVGDIVAVLVALRAGKISRFGAVAFITASLVMLMLGAKAHTREAHQPEQ